MKKLLMTAAVLMLAIAPAMAEDAAAPGAPPAAEKGMDGKERPHKGGMFGMADTDKDGFVTKQEFTARQDVFFSEVDTNKDGKVSPDEMKAHRQAMREKSMEWRKNHPKPEHKAPDRPAGGEVPAQQ